MSYTFWNDFIHTWISPHPAYAMHIHHWTHPNIAGLLNATPGATPSFGYIPEPWWGNAGGSPLHCVFLNHNPYSGGHSQSHAVISGRIGPGLPFATYQDLVAYEVAHYPSRPPTAFRGTCGWHKNKRSNKIIGALNLLTGAAPILLNDISMLLSIELIPWHTANFGGTELGYLLTNHSRLATDVLLFAATESRRIANPILRNKPLIRTNRTRIVQILDTLTAHGDIGGYCISPVHQVGPHNDNWDCFTIRQQGFEEILFFRIQALKNDLRGIHDGTADFLDAVHQTNACP